MRKQLTSARQVTAVGLRAAGCTVAPGERGGDEAADILLPSRAAPWRREPFGPAGEEARSQARQEKARGGDSAGLR